MKILPLFAFLASQEAKDRFAECELSSLKYSYGRKAVVAVLDPLEVMPVGTPKREGMVEVFRGEVNHFHTLVVEGKFKEVEAGWDLDGLVIAHSKRLGSGRQALRKFLAKYPPVDKFTQAYYLRTMVREGD